MGAAEFWAAASLSGGAHAADAYPSKPITLVIPLLARRLDHILGRLLAQKLSEGMKANVIVENKPGANGTIGVDRVAKSAPYGYTVVLADAGWHGDFHQPVPRSCLTSR